MRAAETDAEWTFALDGEQITRVCVDWAALVLLAPPLEIRVEGRCTLGRPGGVVELDPDGGDLAPALRLVRASVAAVRAGKDGWLRVDLVSGGALTVPPDDQYEAWQVADEHGVRIVCTPGGGLAVWSRRDVPR